LPATVALHETVAVPDPVRLVGLIAPQVRPEGMASEKDTIPPKWLSDVTVTFDVADTPTLTATGEDADTVKSRNWKSPVAGWIREPLVPVTVRV